jgi:ribosomal protein S27AE
VKTVASFREPHQAYIAKGRLEAEGIPSFILDEHVVQINWTYSQAIGGVKVQVSETDLERAREVLKSEYQEELSEVEEAKLKPAPEDVCPQCGSTSISKNRYSPWSLIPSLLILLPIFFRKKKWVCGSCGAAW